MRYYIDCEFDGFRGPLISLAIVREDGPSRSYVFVAHAKDSWVKANVLPVLYADPVSEHFWPRDVAAHDIAHFLFGDSNPVITADWPADIRYFCDLIEFPGGKMVDIPALTFEVRRVDAYPTDLDGAVQHNAWWDAMALRHVLERK